MGINFQIYELSIANKQAYREVKIERIFDDGIIWLTFERDKE